MDYVATFNLLEAGFWGLCGGVVFVESLRKPKSRSGQLIMAFALFAFGGSDLVEIQTGAWWRPWWLLVWKGVCLTTLFVCAMRWLIRRPRAGKQIASP